jgi:hypothetical protein
MRLGRNRLNIPAQRSHVVCGILGDTEGDTRLRAYFAVTSPLLHSN